MLTVAEFYEAYARHRRRTRWVPVLLLLVFAGVGISLYFVIDPQLDVLRSRVPRSTFSAVKMFSIVLGGGLAFGLTALVGLVAFRISARLARRDPHLSCPHCGKGLTLAFQAIVASRCCPRCGRELLTDPYPTVPPPLSREEADARASRWRRYRRSVWFQFGIMIVLLDVSGWGFKYLQEQGSLSERDWHTADFASAMAFLAWLSWMVIRSYRERRRQVPCPRCGHEQTLTFTACYGGCARCSQPLVAGGPALPVAAG